MFLTETLPVVHSVNHPSPHVSATLPSVKPVSSAAPSTLHAATVGATIATHHDRNAKFRPCMEDEVAIHVCDSMPAAFVAVYDGHGGSAVAVALRQLLHTIFLDELLSPAHHHMAVRHHAPLPHHQDTTSNSTPLDTKAAFHRAYRRMDRLLEDRRNFRVGATAVTAFLRRSSSGARILTVANCGDARAVLSRGGRAMRLSNDHRPIGPERTRVEAAGGFVCSGRVNGVINVARAFGDHCMKSLVVSTPDVVEMRLGPMDDFIVLACDGLYDVMDDTTVIQVAQHAFDRGLSAKEVANVLVKEAIDRRSTDNVSVMVVQLHEDDDDE